MFSVAEIKFTIALNNFILNCILGNALNEINNASCIIAVSQYLSYVLLINNRLNFVHILKSYKFFYTFGGVRLIFYL